jgi:two-component system nitrogen regulation response regulator GlnG
MPALRERRGDIPPLLDHYINAAARELNVPAKRLSADAVQILTERDWPGNVRELKNLCRRLTLMAAGRLVHASDVTGLLQQDGTSRDSGDDWRTGLRAWAEAQLASGRHELLAEAVPEFERILIDAALGHTGGRRQDAAKLLGWGRNTLTRKLKDLDS